MDSLDSQALSIDTTEDAAYFFSLLSCCSKELGLQDLARIAASSKLLKEACVAIAGRDLHKLLGAAVVQAAEADAEFSAAEEEATAACVAAHCGGYDSEGGSYAPGGFVWDDYLPYEDRYVAPLKTAYKLQVHAVAWLLRAVL
jgi:hypothetical protein